VLCNEKLNSCNDVVFKEKMRGQRHAQKMDVANKLIDILRSLSKTVAKKARQHDSDED